MSEAELHMIKSRMLQGLYHKAQKGELKFKLPVGYQFDPDDKIIKSLDEQVTHIIDLTFKKFFEIGTVNGVLKHLLEENLLFPRQASFEKNFAGSAHIIRPFVIPLAIPFTPELMSWVEPKLSKNWMNMATKNHDKKSKI